MSRGQAKRWIDLTHRGPIQRRFLPFHFEALTGEQQSVVVEFVTFLLSLADDAVHHGLWGESEINEKAGW